MRFSGDTSNMESICRNCGVRYGAHYGSDCPEDTEDYAYETEIVHKYWICYVSGDSASSFSRLDSLEGAEDEAVRLSILRNSEVYVYEFIGSCVPRESPVNWKIPR